MPSHICHLSFEVFCVDKFMYLDMGGINSKEKKKGNKAREREDCRGQFSMALSSVGSLQRRAW